MRKELPIGAVFSILMLVGLTACSTSTLTPKERAEGQRILEMARDQNISAKMAALAREKFSDVEPLPSRTQANVQYPQPMVQQEPPYPFEMRHRNIQGIVWLGVVIDQSGKTERIEVLSSEQPVFSEAAKAAVSRWQFRPAAVNGNPVRAVLCFPLTFTLD